MTLSAGIPALDRYLAESYASVPGMSSRFAATIAGATMRLQSENEITGHVAEIGAFEGRFLIALAHALQKGERAIGIDHFTWPDAGVRGRMESNCAKFGPADDRILVLQADSLNLAPDALLLLARGARFRFFHIDGEHTLKHLSSDLALALATLDPKGIICLDDMLHPGYPTLMLAVDQCLRANPELRVFCVIDREDIVAAAKFMICRDAYADFYIDGLKRAFPQYLWQMTADFGAYQAIVLTPEPKLADIG